LQDELRKTPAIEKRSRQLSRALMKKGFEPIFMEMDEKQQLIAGNAMLRQMAKIADLTIKWKATVKWLITSKRVNTCLITSYLTLA
jgi:hypothetical protein